MAKSATSKTTAGKSASGTKKKTTAKKTVTKRTRKSTKKKTETVAESNSQEETDGKPAKKTKAKRTSTRKSTKKANTETPDMTDGFAAGLLDETDTTSKPKKTRSRKTTAKKRTTKQDDSAGDAETKPKAKRSASKKSSRKKSESETTKNTGTGKDIPPGEPDLSFGPEFAEGGQSKKDPKPSRTIAATLKEIPANFVTPAMNPTGSKPGPKRNAPQNSNNDDNAGGKRRRRRNRRGSAPNNGGNQNNNNYGGKQNNRNDRGKSSYNDRKPKRQKFNKSAPVTDEVTGELYGIVELHPTKGYGFVREPDKNFASQEEDAFISSSLVEKYKLREGSMVRGGVGPGIKNQGPRLKTVTEIDGMVPELYADIPEFDDLTPITPYQPIKLETSQLPLTTRVIDLVSPIGKGQRALIVAPPRSGKTMLIQEIADSISINHPEVHLMMLLIDERPEEVTEMRRRVEGEVIASSMDQDTESHVRISQLIFERAKRLAEQGKDVVILFDSITRTARAFNKRTRGGGKIGSGGIDVKALDIPRKLFGTARQFDEGGSLTVIATALIDTGSAGDEAIFQEFKGTGNMELVLDRKLADRRIWPAIDIKQSGTRREEKLLTPEQLDGITTMRRHLFSLSPADAMQQLTDTLKRFKTNQEFLEKIRTIL